MMTSSNGSIFRVTGPLGGESTSGQWSPSQRQVKQSVFFDLRLNKRFSKQSRRRWFESSPREPHALACGPSSSHTKIFRVERARLKTAEKIPILCKCCTYRFIRYYSTCYVKIRIDSPMANIRNPDFFASLVVNAAWFVVVRPCYLNRDLLSEPKGNWQDRFQAQLLRNWPVRANLRGHHAHYDVMCNDCFAQKMNELSDPQLYMKWFTTERGFIPPQSMMTSWQGNAFRISGSLWGKSAADRTPLTKSITRSFVVSFVVCWTSCWTNSRVVGCYETPWGSCDVI